MKYPFWLPRPRRHWLRSIELGLIGIPVIFILRISFYLVATASFIETITRDAPSSPWFWIWLVFCLLFPPYVFAHFYQFFHDDPCESFPDWLPRFRCLLMGGIYWVIFIAGVLITLLIWFDYDNERYYLETQQEYIERVSPYLTMTWVISAAYLFMLKDGIVWLFKELIKLLYALVGKTPKWAKAEKPQNNDVEINEDFR